MNHMSEGKGEVRFIGTVDSAGDPCSITIDPEYCPALLGVENYSHLLVLYWFHLRDNEKHRGTLRVTPPRHEGAPLTGVFACRSPSRPNPIGVTVVELLRVEGCRLEVSGLDALEVSPILDLMPFSPRAYSVPDASTPEWSKRGPPA